MVFVRDRLAASVAIAVPITIALGAKAALVALMIFALAAWFAQVNIRSFVFPTLADLAAWPGPLLYLFVVLACFSALWSFYPSHAFKAGLYLLIVVVTGQVLRAALKGFSSASAVLTAGWFLIGVAIGVALLIFEFSSNFLIQKTLFHIFPNLLPDQSSMIYAAGENFNIVPEVANWSVAGMTMLAWPALLIAAKLSEFATRAVWLAVLSVLFLVMIGTSEHETSKLAAIVGLMAFVMGRYLPEWAPKAVGVLSVILLAIVVPLTLGAVKTYRLEQASWAQFSLKDRFRIWANVSENVLNSPLHGIGADNTTTLETRFTPSTVPALRPRADKVEFHHPHSVFLQAWLEFGLIGALLLGALLFSAFAMLLEVPVGERPFAFATLVTVVSEAAASWDLWSVWLLATIALTFCILGLGLRLARDGTNTRFGDIWLPRRQIL